MATGGADNVWLVQVGELGPESSDGTDGQYPSFEAFREAGDPFDAETAEKLEKHILSVGGSAEAADLYTAFRGRMPGPEALLRGRGLAA